MKFTKKTRKLTLLYLNLVLTIATLVSFTYSTFAWFTTNRKVSVVLQSVQVAIPGFIVNNYTIYGVTAMTKDATNTKCRNYINEWVDFCLTFLCERQQYIVRNHRDPAHENNVVSCDNN